MYKMSRTMFLFACMNFLHMIASQQMPGSDRDINGCLGSAGYTWCESSGECQRNWETPCIVSPDVSPDVSQDMNSQAIPFVCSLWFDGCNTCEVIQGAIRSCTMMYCMTTMEPACLAYPSDGH